jgi:hypothetical protein
MIDNNLDLPWFWEYISFNPNLTTNFIERHQNRKFNWMHISGNYLQKCASLRLIKQKKISKWWKTKLISIRIKRLNLVINLLDEFLYGNKDIISLIVCYLF